MSPPRPGPGMSSSPGFTAGWDSCPGLGAFLWRRQGWEIRAGIQRPQVLRAGQGEWVDACLFVLGVLVGRLLLLTKAPETGSCPSALGLCLPFRLRPLVPSGLWSEPAGLKASSALGGVPGGGGSHFLLPHFPHVLLQSPGTLCTQDAQSSPTEPFLGTCPLLS